MATVTITTAGCTAPSSTSLGYVGGDGGNPIAGLTFGSGNTEFATGEYTAASVADGSSVTSTTNSAYSGVLIGLLIPAAARSGITQFDYGTTAAGQDGYGRGGYSVYIYKSSNNTWEAWGANPETKTVSIANYIDANYRVWFLVMNQYQFDSNASTCYASVDYMYLTVTYTPATSFTPIITQF